MTTARVTTRERGTIPGCRKAGPDSHMAVDRQSRPWTHSPSDVDAYLAKLRAETRQSRINRGADPETGLNLSERDYIGRIEFQSAGAMRKR